MKGLILKDLYSIRLNLLIARIILILPNLELAVFGGELLEEDTGAGIEQILLIMPYVLMNFISITVLSSLMLNTLEYDRSTGWEMLQRTMPVSSGDIIKGKLIVTLLCVGGLAAMSAALNLIGVFAYGVPMEPLITIPFCIGLMQVISISPTFPTALKIGIKWTLWLYVGFVLITAAAAGTALWFAATKSDGAPLTVIRLVFYIGLPILAAAVLALSYSAGKKAYTGEIN